MPCKIDTWHHGWERKKRIQFHLRGPDELFQFIFNCLLLGPLNRIECQWHTQEKICCAFFSLPSEKYTSKLVLFDIMKEYVNQLKKNSERKYDAVHLSCSIDMLHIVNIQMEACVCAWHTCLAQQRENKKNFTRDFVCKWENITA